MSLFVFICKIIKIAAQDIHLYQFVYLLSLTDDHQADNANITTEEEVTEDGEDLLDFSALKLTENMHLFMDHLDGTAGSMALCTIIYIVQRGL